MNLGSSATTIQRFFRSSKSYSMMTNGNQQLADSKYFPQQEVSEAPPGSQNLAARARGEGVRPRARNTAAFQAISKNNVEKLKLAVQYSTHSEVRTFVQKFCSLNFELTHYSNFTEGIEKGIHPLKELLNEREYEGLHEAWRRENKFNERQLGNTFKEDIEELADTGFSFFHLHPQNFDGGGSRLGAMVYKISVDRARLESQNISLTYDDRLAAIHNHGRRPDGSVYKTGSVFYSTFIAPHLPRDLARSEKEFIDTHFEILFTELKQNLDKHVSLHFLMGADIHVGIACALVLLKNKLEEYLFLMDNTDQNKMSIHIFQLVLQHVSEFMNSPESAAPCEINALVNGWIRPIVRLPGVAYPD